MSRSFRYITSLILLLLPGYLISQEIPEKPLIKYVSYDSDNNLIHIAWEASKTPDVDSNRIRIVEVSENDIVTGHEVIATLPGNILEYEFTPLLPYPQYYTIVAIKDDEYSNLGGDYHKAVKLETEYDSCQNKINLTWDAYIGWSELLIGYKIWQKGSSGFFEDIAIVNSNTKSYTIFDVDLNTNYEYYIESLSALNYRSSSNKKKLYTYSPIPPEITIDNVSITDESSALIHFSVSNLDEINDFRLLRSGAIDSEFQTRSTLNNIPDRSTTVSDNFPTQGENYYFRIDALNSCSKSIGSSNIVNNILLRGSTDNTNVELNWTEIQGYKNGIKGYKIWRLSAYNEFTEVTFMEGQNHSYQEAIPLDENALSGELMYYVEAIENGQEIGSISNTLKIKTETHIAVPNAFTPNYDGHNDVFKPVMDYIPEFYLMIVFDRSGKKIFETEDPEHGWDGTLNGGAMAMQGVYVYHIQYTSYNGVRNSKTGNVSLIIP